MKNNRNIKQMRQQMMKTKKLFLLLAMLLMAFDIQAQNTEFETAAEAVKNMKVGINCLSFELDGYNYRYSNDRNWKSEWKWVGQNAAELPKMLRNAGYNTMRLMIPWRRFMDSSGKIDTQWMAHVRECVDYVIDQGMYCTISNLFDTGEEGRLIYSEEENYNEYKELFEYFWVQVAEEFKDYDHHLIFEGWNEMLDRYGWEGNPNGYANPEQFEPLNEYAQSFVNAVRSTGGNNSYRNLLINTFGACGGIEGDWIPALSYFKVPNDKNIGHIFVGIHAYHDVTDMNALAEFDNCMTKWRKWSESNAVPIILGELGLGGMVRDYFEHPEDTKNFWRHIVQSSRLNNIIPFVFLWSPLGTYRQMPAFDVPDLHKAILKGYYGEDYEPRMLTDEDYNVWISFKPENTICWMWADPLETNTYKGFLFEIENYPGDGLLDMHIGDGENFVIKPVTSASTFFDFIPEEVGNDAGAIFIEYKGNEPYTMKVKRIVMQKRDGREFAFAAPIWIQRHDPNGSIGPNFECKRKQFVHTVGFDHLWAELNLFDDEIPLKLRNYKGIRVEFAEPINVDDFGIKVYADNGAVEDGQAPNSSTSATILFSDFNVNDVINRVTLQYCKENKGEAKVVSAWLIRQDGTEEYSDISPFWGCEITERTPYEAATKEDFDVTDQYLVNPSFDSDLHGWMNAGGTAKWREHVWEALNNFCEFEWTGSAIANQEVVQMVTLPAGNYRLSLNCASDPSSSGLFLMAGNNREEMHGTGGVDAFSLEFQIASETTISLGLKVENTTATWVNFDNFKLERLESPTGIHVISATPTKNNSVIYNLWGQKLAKPQKGINIIAGKKVLVK